MAEPACSLVMHQRGLGCETQLAAIWGRSLEQEAMRRNVPLAKELHLVRRFNPLLLLADLHRIREFLQRNSIDLVHSHLLHDHWMAALAIRGMQQPRPKLVRTVHRYERMRRDPLHSWLFCDATDAVITVSTEQQGLIESAYPQVRGRVRMIPGGVDPFRFRPDLAGAGAVRADMGEKPEAAVAGIVAHLGYNRGLQWLLKAAPAVVEKVPEATIWIVGQGELKYKLRTELLKPIFRGRVVMAGYRSDDLPETYAAMDVGMLLGLGSEGSARAALETMASARPVIAVRKGALADTITDGVDGLLVPENNVTALSDALIRLLSNKPLARKMGAAAREKILAGFTEQIRAERTLELYKELLRTP